MRRALALPIAAALTACGIFNDIVLPSDAGPDVVDAQLDAAADAAFTSYLTREDALKFCSLVIGCPGTAYLPLSVEVSFALPIAPVNVKSQFSMCMHWLTEVATPDRFGFAAQQAALQAIAGAQCTNINNVMPILVDKITPPACAQPDAGATACASGAAVVFCEGVAAGTAPCRTPLYGGSSCTAVGATFSCVGGLPCTQTPSCDGGVASYCSNDNRQGAINCALWGRDCVAQPVPRCEQGGSCTAWRCDGQTLHPCGTGTEGPPFNCPTGTTCAFLSQGGGYCATPGSSCSPEQGGDRCDGDTLHYCAGGHDSTFDCATVGWFCRSPIGGVASCYPTRF